MSYQVNVSKTKKDFFFFLRLYTFDGGYLRVLVNWLVTLYQLICGSADAAPPLSNSITTSQTTRPRQIQTEGTFP